MLDNNLMVDRQEFRLLNGKKMHFIGFVKPHSIMAWEDASINYGDHHYKWNNLNVREVGIENLMALDVWKDLDVDLQQELVDGKVVEKRTDKQDKQEKQDRKEHKAEVKAEEKEIKRKRYNISLNN